MRNLFETSVQYLKGVGPKRKKTLERLGIDTLEDLLYLFPRRYEDRRQMTPLSNLKLGEYQTIAGKILRVDGRRSWYTKKHVFEAEIGDESSRVFCVWFNRPYMDKYLNVGQEIILYGKVDLYKDRFQIVCPDYEIISDDEEDRSLSVGRIVPIYPLTRGVSQRYLRKAVKRCLEAHASAIKDIIPYDIRKKYGLDNLVKSLWSIHFPESNEAQAVAYKRVSFEEFFLFQISVFLRRMSIVTKQGVAHKIENDFYVKFLSLFPFELTNSQRKVIDDIARDLKANVPMHRLLQGDVGSGKTLVAFFGCFAAVANGYQAAIMAPTEILARQHFENIKKIIKGSFLSDMTVQLLTNEVDKKKRGKIIAETTQGKVNILIGTHALIQEEVDFKNLSFVVIDEQHKFGVRQRSLLSAKGKNPDVLVMTATPIPRTLCLTLYGDLDVSTITEIPPGHGKIRTALFSHENATQAYAQVREAVGRGEQAYIIYPIIDESETLDLKSAEEMFKEFQKGEFKHLKLGLLHGQIKKQEAQVLMQKFIDKEIDVLVATTILEVGVDVPNATTMIIEHADRFGLSTLHQLRGRIGRGRANSKCLLVADPTTEDGQERVKAILSTTDGFEIAQKDLEIRGPGEFFGRHQHGLNELKIANPATQLDILQQAREEALRLTKEDPLLENPKNGIIKDVILRRYPAYLENILSG